MDNLRQYNIAYKGLSVGNHEFDFKVSDSLFEAFPTSEISHGSCDVHVDLQKQGSMLLLDVTINGFVTVACDRCLEEFEMPVDYEGELVVRFSESASEDENDGDIMWLNPSEDELPLGQYIYESICLSLPYQKVHPEDENGNSECNPDMLSRFKMVSEDEFESLVDKRRAESQWGDLAAIKDSLEKEEK